MTHNPNIYFQSLCVVCSDWSLYGCRWLIRHNGSFLEDFTQLSFVGETEKPYTMRCHRTSETISLFVYGVGLTFIWNQHKVNHIRYFIVLFLEMQIFTTYVKNQKNPYFFLDANRHGCPHFLRRLEDKFHRYGTVKTSDDKSPPRRSTTARPPSWWSYGFRFYQCNQFKAKNKLDICTQDLRCS